MKPVTHKFAAVLNRKIPVNILMNALAHMAAGLAGSSPQPELMRFDTYTDKDGGQHPSISDNPFIILQADNSNQLRTLRQKLIDQRVHFTDFTHTMIEGTYAQQHERTADTLESELEYYGVCLFGELDKVQELTRKFSLWRGQ